MTTFEKGLAMIFVVVEIPGRRRSTLHNRSRL